MSPICSKSHSTQDQIPLYRKQFLDVRLNNFMRDFSITKWPLDCVALIKRIKDEKRLPLQISTVRDVSDKFDAVSRYFDLKIILLITVNNTTYILIYYIEILFDIILHVEEFMKKLLIPIILVCCLAFIFIYHNKRTTSESYTPQEALKQGVQSEKINENNVIEIVDLNDGSKLVFFEKNNNLGVATINFKDNNWKWVRNTGFFNSKQVNSESPLTSIGIEVSDLYGSKIPIQMGEVLDNNISRIEVKTSADQKNALIKEYNGKKYWFVILDNFNPVNEIIGLSKTGKRIN